MKDFLNHLYPIPDDILEAYSALWKPIEMKKKDLITREGQTERYMYFVLEGIQRSYYINKGKEHVIAFTYPPSFSGMPESFISQTPSRYFLECLTDSSFLRISYEDHQQMLKKHRAIETAFRIGTEKLLVGMLDRYYELLAFDIEERFKAFTTRSPHLLNMVPHKHLASYLRIDPSNFSRLMGKITI
jgi:CRP-like cAMP-binding protein